MESAEHKISNFTLKDLNDAELQLQKINTLLKCADDVAVKLSGGLQAENIQNLILVIMDAQDILSKELEKARGHATILEIMIRKKEETELASKSERIMN
jgi:acid phosphatase family membrane protein YuiD